MSLKKIHNIVNKMTRQQANIQLVHELMRLVELYPDQRFSQILLNYRFVKQERPMKPNQDIHVSWQDEYYVEPDIILERVNGKS